jgi:uncharacterized protein (TIGR02271 family)
VGIGNNQVNLYKPGSTSNTMTGDLIKMGVKQQELDFYSRELAEGRNIVAVITDDRQREVIDILVRGGASNPNMNLQEKLTGSQGNLDVPLHGEQLQVSKQAVQAGEVDVQKVVVSEPQTVNVPVTHEEVIIEQHAVQPTVTGTPISEGEDETIRVPVNKDQVNVSKQTVDSGEVAIGKRQVQQTEQVSDTVQREEARIERAYNENAQRQQ